MPRVNETFRQLQMFARSSERRPSSNNNNNKAIKMGAQLDNRTNVVQPHNFRVLPKRLISIFGLESSGTSLLTDAIAKACGTKKYKRFGGLIYGDYDTRIQVQHISLPWGFIHKDNKNQTVVDIDFLPPYSCMAYPHLHEPSRQEREDSRAPHKFCSEEIGLPGDKRIKLPQRFNVNITSHVRWYQKHGSQVTAVIMVRGDYTHVHGKLNHNDNLNQAWKEDLHGKRLIVDAIQQLSSLPKNGNPPELIIASYETLMSLQKPYLFDLYKQLGIQSTYAPGLKDGNKKYIIPPRGVDNETWKNINPGRL